MFVFGMMHHITDNLFSLLCLKSVDEFMTHTNRI
jgi:hypothetical protein